MKFKDHKYTWDKPFTSIRHDWSFRGPHGGLNFHVSINDNYGDSCGLEFHHNYNIHDEPCAADHAHCWLTKQPCWHDGTSLYASESVWPFVQSYLKTGEHEKIFRYLEEEYERHFEPLKREET